MLNAQKRKHGTLTFTCLIAVLKHCAGFHNVVVLITNIDQQKRIGNIWSICADSWIRSIRPEPLADHLANVHFHPPATGRDVSRNVGGCASMLLQSTF